MENKEKEIFDKNQQKQAQFAKRYLLCAFSGVGAAFTVAAAVLFCLNTAKEIPIVFIAIGLFMIALGVVLFFAIPTKYDYGKYKARVEKYGLMNIYEMNAKIKELEERLAALENKNKQ